MNKIHYAGDKEDRYSFGSLFEIVGGILFSYAIIKFLNSLGETIFNSIFLTACLGYLIFTFGASIKLGYKGEVKKSIINLLWVVFLLFILALLIVLNSR